MLFNTLQFIIFIILVLYIYYKIPQVAKWIWLLVASCFFYAVLAPYYLLLLILIIVIDYTTGIGFSLTTNNMFRKMLLLTSIVSNLSILFFFKYYDFFIFNINQCSSTSFSLLHLVLPVGLSFHTFQSMSYTIELYRNTIKPEKNIIVFALYVMFFPQLVAGPIERPQHFLPQFRLPKIISNEAIKSSLLLIMWGFIKKVVISDRIAMYTKDVFANYSDYSFVALLLTTLFFSIQIYCDFSGYTDIARGLAKLLGYDLMLNFNFPYFAKNCKEFWNRWHISLSSWFRDYVYIPLGGNKKGFLKYAILILFVFALSGFWHGAQWNFICWGLIHAMALLVQYFLNVKKIVLFKNDTLKTIFTFSFICFTWIFFRAESIQHALCFIKGIFVFQKGILYNFHYTLSYLMYCILLVVSLFVFERCYHAKFLNTSSFYSKIILSFFIIYFLGVFNESPFIYFQF